MAPDAVPAGPIAGPLPEPPHAAGGAAVWRGIKNSVLPRYRPVPLDLHRPAGPALSPLVAFVHGGRWQQGAAPPSGPVRATSS